MSGQKTVLFVTTGVLAIVGFVSLVLSVGIQYLADRWILFFETCAGVTRTLVDYFMHSDHVGMMIALLFVCSGVVYMGIVAVLEIIQLRLVRDRFTREQTRVLHGGVRVVAEQEPFAMTIGLLQPQVYVSEGLVQAMSAKAFEAIVAHEHYHKQAKHPLVSFLLRLLHALFFYVPGMRALRRYASVRQEIAADRYAISATSRISVAEALLSLFGSPVRQQLAAASRFSSIAERIDFVVHEKEPQVNHRVALSALFVSGIVCAIVFGFVLIVPQHSSAAPATFYDAQICEGLLQSTIQSLL